MGNPGKKLGKSWEPWRRQRPFNPAAINIFPVPSGHANQRCQPPRNLLLHLWDAHGKSI